MYTVLRSSRRRTCLRRSPRSSSFRLYVATSASSWFTRSDECLRGTRGGGTGFSEKHLSGYELDYNSHTSRGQSRTFYYQHRCQREAELTCVCGLRGSRSPSVNPEYIKHSSGILSINPSNDQAASPQSVCLNFTLNPDLPTSRVFSPLKAHRFLQRRQILEPR